MISLFRSSLRSYNKVLPFLLFICLLVFLVQLFSFVLVWKKYVPQVITTGISILIFTKDKSYPVSFLKQHRAVRILLSQIYSFQLTFNCCCVFYLYLILIIPPIWIVIIVLVFQCLFIFIHIYTFPVFFLKYILLEIFRVNVVQKLCFCLS